MIFTSNSSMCPLSHLLASRASVFLLSFNPISQVAELLELSGNAAKDLKKKAISPRHLSFFPSPFFPSKELDTFCKKVILPGGGVIPHVSRQGGCRRRRCGLLALFLHCSPICDRFTSSLSSRWEPFAPGSVVVFA